MLFTGKTFSSCNDIVLEEYIKITMKNISAMIVFPISSLADLSPSLSLQLSLSLALHEATISFLHQRITTGILYR